jgi:hypothetical protein
LHYLPVNGFDAEPATGSYTASSFEIQLLIAESINIYHPSIYSPYKTKYFKNLFFSQVWKLKA